MNGQGMPVPVEDFIERSSVLKPQHTALVVIDPWVHMDNGKMDAHFHPVLQDAILPLVSIAYPKMAVIVLTNDPAKSSSYNSQLPSVLWEMSRSGKIHIFYHQNLTASTFAQVLHQNNITDLIYTGFASNLCLLEREGGMFAMRREGFRLFFVPRASAAQELPDTWDSGTMHTCVTNIIAQWIGYLIDYDELMTKLVEYESQ